MCDDQSGAKLAGMRMIDVMDLDLIQQSTLLRRTLIICAAASALLLAGAHLFELFGYPPCALCLDQREAHWTALGVAAMGLIAIFGFRATVVAAATIGALALVYAFSASLAFFHTGVEFGFWPGPPGCTTLGKAVTELGTLQDALTQKPAGPSCEEAAWRLLGISMAGYNLLASAGLLAVSLVASVDAARQARRARRTRRK